MQCYHELVPPTAVTHAVALPFLGPNTNNLIVARTSLLQVFNAIASGAAHGERLVLVGEYPLSGTVTGIARVRTLDTQTGGEALLLAFKDAKLSLIEWDPENHRTSTISIHYYEGENVLSQPFGQALADYDSLLTADPGSRCAALKFGAKQLAILPFRQLGDELAGDMVEDAFGPESAVASLKKQESAQHNANGEAEQTPYKASFVLPLTALDPVLNHTVDLAFLHEYREPTFGILSSQIAPSCSLLDERRDILSYTVFTLDLEQRASTNLITVPKLPSTLWKVFPLPLPIGGALLVGANELVHIDQSGKVNATAVNEFATHESDLGMSDQSHLNFKLENCAIEILDTKTGELLVVLQDGSLVTVRFELLGRSISAIIAARASAEQGIRSVKAAPSCITRIDSSMLFIGSEEGSSSLVRWSKPLASLSRKRSHAQMSGPDVDAEDEDGVEDDDDLYDAVPETKKRATSAAGISSVELDTTFQMKDQLPSLGPINDVCVARSSIGKDKLQLLAATGRRQSTRLACLNRDIAPQLVRKHEFENAKSAWSVRAATQDTDTPSDAHDNLLFVYDGSNTEIYQISTDIDGGYEERQAAEFENEGETLDVRTMAQGSIIVQCRRSEIRTYDTNLALNQIIPMVDDETDDEFNIVHISFCDPYLLVIRDDSSVQILHVQGKEIEPLEGEGIIQEQTWLSGCVYSGDITQSTPALFLLQADGGLHIFDLPSLQPIYAAPTLNSLPPVLSADASQRRQGTKETFTELLIAELGQHGTDHPYLVLRTGLDDLVLYEPFRFPRPDGREPWYSGLRFRKVPVPYIPKFNETISVEESTRSLPLKAVYVNGYSAVSIPGASPCLLLKEPSSLPKVLEIRELQYPDSVKTVSPLSRPGCEQGFFMLGEGNLQEFTLPHDAWYGTGWCVSAIDLGESITAIRHCAYHEARGMFVVATCRSDDFYFAEEDGRHPEQDDITMRPQVPQYSIQLISARTRRVVHSFDMPHLETVTALKIMPLDISENTHEQQLRVVVTTAAQRGEDIPAKGALTVLDVLEVVPEPDVADSGFKLHVVAREEARGAMTALSSFPGGLIGTVQGQKIMVRGLKEDGTCLPVAFLDAQCHTSTIKTLNNRGMWLAGDAWKGLWFGGFTEEPYKLVILGKSPKTKMEVMAAEFLPFEGSLYVLAIDADMDLHVLQYDPEHPEAQDGRRLLHRSTFHVGHFPTTMTLLPSTLMSLVNQQAKLSNGDLNGDGAHLEEPETLFHVLTTSLTGSIGLITPLDEAAYRRLAGLQTHLTSILEHAAGLNPRAYRSIESESLIGARGVVDGSLVRRISELGATRRADVLSRAGADMWSLRSDLQVVGGGGLGYL